MTAASPALILRRSASEMADWLATEPGFLSGLCKVDGKPLRLERFQRAFLLDRSRFRCVNKARQTGFSFVMAAEALVRALLRPGYTAVFLSYNLDDAKEKIRYAKMLYEKLPLGFQRKLVAESKSELQFEWPTGRPSRIVSNPSRAPRGKAQADIYLDEFAHYANDRDVYKGSTALIVRSPRAQLTMASSPLGKRGVFWEIDSQELRPYQAYTRRRVPWWLSVHMCKNIREAAALAPGVSTEERVERWARAAIADQFASMTLEDFRQEYEVEYTPDGDSFYPYDLILPCTRDDIDTPEDMSLLPPPRGRRVAGYDVARSEHDSALSVFDEDDNGNMSFCGLWSWNGLSFDEQEANLRQLLAGSLIDRLRIDKTGLGMHLAENLERDHDQVEGVTFTNELKAAFARDLKVLFQRRWITLPADRSLISEIHSIVKSQLPSGRSQFNPAASAASTGGSPHADRFWAIALACGKDRVVRRHDHGDVGCRVIGAGGHSAVVPVEAVVADERDDVNDLMATLRLEQAEEDAAVAAMRGLFEVH